MPALEKIIAALAQGKVTFPTHAEVALRVRVALDDPDIHIAKAAQLIQAEPLLASRVVALANSVAFRRSGRPITELPTALSCLGLQFVRALAMAVVMQQMAHTLKRPKCKALAEALWEHTMHVSTLAYALAGHFSVVGADTALFAGIVHEVGGFYLLSVADVYPEWFDDDVVCQSPAAEAVVSRAVTTALAVPEEVALAVGRLHEAGSAECEFPPATLSAVLSQANRWASVPSPLQQQTIAVQELDPDALAVLTKVREQSAYAVEALMVALRY